MSKGYSEALIRIKDGKYIRLYYDNHFFHTPYALPEKVNPNQENPYFSAKRGKLKSGFGKNFNEVNQVLQERKSELDSLIIEAEKQHLDALDYINNHFLKRNSELKEEIITRSTQLAEVFEIWCDKKIKKEQGKKRSSVTDIPRAVLTNINHYENDINKKHSISEIDMEWIENFSIWCVKEKTRTNEVYRKTENTTYSLTKTIRLSNSTLKRHLIELRAFFEILNSTNDIINFPTEELKKYYSKLPTRHGKKVEKESWSYDYLTQKEWDIVKSYKVPDDRRKEWHQIFDLYIFCVNTGLRFSDLSALCEGDIHNGVIQLHAKKTIIKVQRGAITVKLNLRAEEIITKYKLAHTPKNEAIFGHILPTNQQANQLLRKVFAEIEILHVKKTVINFYLFDQEITYKRKCDVLSWHSSRRTFVNLLVRNGATIQQIQSMTGWIDINSIISYMAQIEDDDEAGLGIVNNF